MKSKYNKESVLTDKLNCFFEEEFSLPASNYYSNLSVDGFLNLKSILSDINNIFTMKVSIAFIHWLSDIYSLNETVTNTLLSELLETKPNTNGFDIETSNQQLNVIAEVKCNVPINGGSIYGSAQRLGIEKDINSLINGKNKSKIDITNCFKFMVFLDKPEIRAATSHFVSNSQNKDNITFFENESMPLDKQKVYIVFVNF